MAGVQGKVARRYANALLSACQPAELEAVRAGLNAFADVWRKDRSLGDVLVNPAVSLDKRKELIKDVATTATKSAPIANFLALLVDNGRITALPEIAVTFAKLVDELKKQLTLEVTSAFPLDDNERRAVTERVHKEFGSLASITWTVDQSLIGGVLLRNGDKLLDGSLRGSLERVRNILQA